MADKLVKIGSIYNTGQTCEQSGTYDFAGYMDGKYDPSPTKDEEKISLSKSKIFPPIRSANKGCKWRLSVKT